jgi:hypothetical protein
MTEVLCNSIQKQYFFDLFIDSLPLETLETLWSAAPDGDEKANWAIESGVCLLDNNQIEVDCSIAASMLKAERRKQAKQRNKQRKKDVAEKQAFSSSKLGKQLSSEQREVYFTVQDVFKDFKFQFTEAIVISTLKIHNFDANTTVDKLISTACCEANSTETAGLNNPRQTLQLEHSSIVVSLEDSRISKAELPFESNHSSRLSHGLCKHFMKLFQQRNNGVLVSVKNDELVFYGTEAPLNIVGPDSAREAIVCFDFHGLTRVPALDLMHSVLLHYVGAWRRYLMSRNSNDLGYIAATSLGGSTSTSTSTSGSCRGRSDCGSFKALVVVLIVGQGMHTRNWNNPVLRTLFQQELKRCWSTLDSYVDPSNPGQIIVKLGSSGI